MDPRRVCLCLPFIALAAAAAAQDAPPVIPNWAAPESWTPPSSRSAGIHTMTATDPLPFVAATPCRLVDTRGNGFTGPYGPPSMAAGVARDFFLRGQCGIPSEALAVSLNITVTNTQGPGFITIYPQGTPQPTVSTLNFVGGQTIANAAVVAMPGGGVTVVAGVSGTDLIIDTNGYYAASSSGTFNTFVGYGTGNTTTTGQNNTAVGVFAFEMNTSGFGNTVLGKSSLPKNTTGNLNTALGYVALPNLVSGSNNIGIGTTAGTQISTGSNNIYIGSPGFNDESGQIRIGDNCCQTGAVMAAVYGNAAILGVPVLIAPGGRLGTNTSSRRFKSGIRDIGSESDQLMRLRPVRFTYRKDLDPTGEIQYGLVAEEVADVYPELVVRDSKGQPEAIRYQEIEPLLLNEVQKQRRTIDEQRSEIEALKARLEKLEAVNAGKR
jgi:hypothetical protein